ncbi:DUF1716-domain-containing protein [Polyplosphaeria fusca]|uniref:DUF1716-domain-containing protein n=1 Tax=Polyplosphaeria fusca TaxID=682080 RepID=A0A9P4QXK4_9PLEO|nr:DUF1716-domain-containing protein [Polyplosphaeria fusca]
MTSIDDLFKGSAASTKRKFENPAEFDPSKAYKSAKLSAGSDVKQASVAEDDDDDDAAGPSLPPDFDEEGDDDEGRFFGEGMDENARDALDYLDANDDEGAIVEEKYDSAWVRKLVNTFEKKVSKNADLRARYEDEASKFMASEADLDDAIKRLSILSEHYHLYEEFAKLGGAERLVQLLAHENTDIAIDAIEIISELTDEDVQAGQEQWDALVTAMLDADLLSLLISNFSRFDEKETADVSGVYHSLSVIENLLSQPANYDLIGSDATLLKWLLQRIESEEKPVTQNKAYATEILSILTQSSTPNRRRIINGNAVDIMLRRLADYRMGDPEKGGDEEEFVENMFNCLTSLVDEREGITKYLAAEGPQLMLLMLRDGRMSKTRALKVLDHACGYIEASTEEEYRNGIPDRKVKGKSKKTDENSQTRTNNVAAVCEVVIDMRGLKPLFSIFMKLKKQDHESAEHLLGIFASLFRSLPGNSVPRYRLLAKFLEKDFEKTNKLISLRRDYAARLAVFDARLNERKARLAPKEQEEFELENISSRLDEGLYCLERIDVVLAWLVAEDDGAKIAIVKALAERDEKLSDVKRTLEAQLNGVLEVEPAERAMLETLVSFLD